MKKQKTNMTKANIAKQLRLARYACERLCGKERSARIDPNRPRNNQDCFQCMVQEIDKLERAHMKFGARPLEKRPSRSSTHETRVNYFVVKILAIDDRPEPAWHDMDTIRSDYRFGLGIQKAIGRHAFRAEIILAGADLDFLEQLEYSTHLA